MASTDSETGEYLCQLYIFQSQQQTNNFENSDFDMETGEPDRNAVIVTKNKPKFTIPKNLINPPEEKKCCIDPNESFPLCGKREVIGLKEEIIFGCNQMSHRLFLILPTLAIFTRMSAILTVLAEVFLHLWSHKKNQHNTNTKIYYRSPLHVITSQFCAVCRQEREMEQVSKLQDRRQRSWRYHLEDVARRIS